MSTTNSKLRLGPRPKTETVKITIALTSVLKADLERYASLHAQPPLCQASCRLKI